MDWSKYKNCLASMIMRDINPNAFSKVSGFCRTLIKSGFDMTRYTGSFRMFSHNQAASGFVEHYGHDTKHHQPSTTGNASFQIQTSPVWDPMSFTILVPEFSPLDPYIPIFQGSLSAGHDIGVHYPLSSLEAFCKGVASAPYILYAWL